MIAAYVFAVTTVISTSGWLRERRHHRHSVHILADAILEGLDKNEDIDGGWNSGTCSTT